MRVEVVVAKTKIFSKALLMFILAVSFLFGGSVLADTSECLDDIKLNEIYPFSSNEFVELINIGNDECALSGWSITDSLGEENNDSHRKYFSDITIKPSEYVFLEGNLYLNDTGDTVKLYDKNKKIKETVSYGSDGDGSAFSLISSAWKWSYEITKGQKNPIEEIPPVDDVEEESDSDCSVDVSLNEVLPNPSGDETRNEYIEIKNNSDSLVDLEGWKLYDSVLKEKYDDGEDSGYEIPAGNSVKPGDFWIIYRDDFKFSLHNTQEEAVFLKDSCGNFISKTYIFKGAKEDYTYSFDGTRWRWSSFLTPEKENKFDSAPQVEIIIDKKVFKDISANFEAIITGKGKNSAKVDWDFGDDSGSTKKKTTHTYEEVGKYSASVKVSGAGEDFFKRFDISVEKFKYPEVRIVGINPNPPGKDEESESITIKNKSKKEINLNGWSIASGSSSSKLTNHPITEDLFVKAGKILEITREFSKFSLGNLKTKIELRYPDGDVAHEAKYKSEKTIKDGMVYEKKDGGGWEWRENVEDVEDIQIVQDVQNDENAEFVQDGEGGQLERFEQFEQVSDGFGFGFGEEEDALEVVEMLVNELERDIDEIYAEGEAQDAGDVQNVEIVQDVEDVQGVQDVKIVQIVFPGVSKSIVKMEIPGKNDTGTKVVGIENNEYKFTKPLPEEDHYAIKFAKNITSDMNMALNVVMRKLQN